MCGDGKQSYRNIGTPLVTIGIPTYNRPEELRRAIKSATTQTYKNLEIIISDNCSPNDSSRDIIKEFSDSRIIYYHQRRNEGRNYNMMFVLGKATGDYFMWLSDDDWLEPTFVEKCLEQLTQHPELAACGMEAQYFDDSGNLVFFAEGTHFRDMNLSSSVDRTRYILRHNYGNMFYSLFRYSTIAGYQMKGDNEIPLFLRVAERGNWMVLPEIGVHKKTTIPTYEQARWETKGGWRTGNLNLLSTTAYHYYALVDISRAISNLNVKGKRGLYLYNVWLLTKHLLQLIIGWKPK